MSESEEMVWSDLVLSDPEPLKSEINREVGKSCCSKILPVFVLRRTRNLTAVPQPY